MRTFVRITIAVLTLTAGLVASAADNPFLGDWALTIPGGAAGWLGVEEINGHLQASLASYSRIKPTMAAERPPGEWQTLEIVFVDRHATVMFNAKEIMDNQPVRGSTGGAPWSDINRPGPLYLQSDHTSIEYRNIVIRPVVRPS